MSESFAKRYPFVSVIIPVYNDALRIVKAIEALQGQSFPADRYEVIVVDNGSTDATKEVVAKYPVRLFEETETQSPYAARNKGISEAQGEVLAFTDSDCVPQPNWIEAGVAALESSGVGLVGGHIRFRLSPRASCAEYYDAICNVRMKENIESRGVCYTGNLFVRKEVVADIGAFPQYLRSGGDVYFTSRASAAGYKIVFATDAVVEYPARQLLGLLRKALRTGKGKVSLLQKATQAGPINKSVKPGRFLTNINPFILRQRLIADGYRTGPVKFLGIVAVAYLVLLAGVIGALQGYLLRKKRTGRQ